MELQNMFQQGEQNNAIQPGDVELDQGERSLGHE